MTLEKQTLKASKNYGQLDYSQPIKSNNIEYSERELEIFAILANHQIVEVDYTVMKFKHVKESVVNLVLASSHIWTPSTI